MGSGDWNNTETGWAGIVAAARGRTAERDSRKKQENCPEPGDGDERKERLMGRHRAFAGYLSIGPATATNALPATNSPPRNSSRASGSMIMNE